MNSPDCEDNTPFIINDEDIDHAFDIDRRIKDTGYYVDNVEHPDRRCHGPDYSAVYDDLPF